MLASLIQDGLSAVTARDTVAAMAAVHAAEDALPHGPHPLRRYLRAAECAVDIAQWDQAAGHLRGAVAVAVHPAVGLPLAS